MNKLVMSALLFGTLAQAAGCIFTSDDSSSSGTATVNVSWTLLNDTDPANCPAGATTATIYAQRGTDQPFTDTYNCSDLSGASADLPEGDYTMWVEITDTSGATLYAQSEDFQISLTDGEVATADFQIDVANGFFDVSWVLDTNQQTPTTCAAVTAQNGVSVISTVAGNTNGVDSIFNCADGESPNKVTTDAVGIGQVVVSEELIDSTGAQIGNAPAINTNIDYGNEYVDLYTTPAVISLF